jgi:hypothetical protein
MMTMIDALVIGTSGKKWMGILQAVNHQTSTDNDNDNSHFQYERLDDIQSIPLVMAVVVVVVG